MKRRRRDDPHAFDGRELRRPTWATKFNGYVFMLASAALLSFLGWLGTATVDHGMRLAAIEQHERGVDAWLAQVDAKLDKLVGRSPARPRWYDESKEPGGISHTPLADVLLPW